MIMIIFISKFFYPTKNILFFKNTHTHTHKFLLDTHLLILIITNESL